MSYTLSFLCWISAWGFLCLWGTSAQDFNVSSSPLQTNSSAPMGLHGYKRYFANDSLIGRPVPCTREDKICFRYNLVFNPLEDRCLPLSKLDDNCGLRVNRTDLMGSEDSSEDRYKGVGDCRFCVDPCTTGYRMAYDGICYDKEVVRDVICGREAKITRHPVDGHECRIAPATPITVQQPDEDGSCVIPDLRFPNTARKVFILYNPTIAIEGFKENGPFECESNQSVCFSEGKVFVAGHDGCHDLLKRGPCEEDHVVALDLEAAIQGRAEGTCVHKRGGCPKGYKRMAFNGKCHENREIEIQASGIIILNPFGKYVVYNVDSIDFHPKLKAGKCAIDSRTIRVVIISSNIMDSCGSEPDDVWNRVVDKPPQPEF